MNGFRNWFSRMMIGRYGNDELNRFLLIVAAVFILAGIFIARRWINVLVVIILAIVYGRMFSRNISKRQQENSKYMEIKANLTGGRKAGGSGGQRPGSGRPGKGSDDGKRIYICPNCKGSLKVPVGAGKIRIKCPHCGETFEEIV